MDVAVTIVDVIEMPVSGLRVTTQFGSLDMAVDWRDVTGADSYLVRWRQHGPGQTLNEGVRSTSSDATVTAGDSSKWVVRVQA